MSYIVALVHVNVDMPDALFVIVVCLVHFGHCSEELYTTLRRYMYDAGSLTCPGRKRSGTRLLQKHWLQQP